MRDLLAAALGLVPQLRTALAQHLRRLECLAAHLGRAAIESLAELATPLLLQLDRFLLDVRSDVTKL